MFTCLYGPTVLLSARSSIFLQVTVLLSARSSIFLQVTVLFLTEWPDTNVQVIFDEEDDGNGDPLLATFCHMKPLFSHRSAIFAQKACSNNGCFLHIRQYAPYFTSIIPVLLARVVHGVIAKPSTCAATTSIVHIVEHNEAGR